MNDARWVAIVRHYVTHLAGLLHGLVAQAEVPLLQVMHPLASAVKESQEMHPLASWCRDEHMLTCHANHIEH